MIIKNIIRKPLLLGERCSGIIYRQMTKNDWSKSIDERITSIPQSNGSKIYHRINVRIGFICDEFIYENYKDSCDFVYLSPTNWKDAICSLQCIVITSVWHGLNGEWVNICDSNSISHSVLSAICSRARKLNIPVVFYSKEDPPNFNHFLSIAKYADILFTTAVECIELYKCIFPFRPCYHLPFCINPMLHNPIGIGSHYINNAILFAGSYMRKYPKRTKAQEQLFDFSQKQGLDLVIIDRNYNRNETKYHYPLKYRKNVIHNYSYRDIAKIYKLIPYIINLNSVTNSKSMFANRIYDASACGSILLSNNSVGMAELFTNTITDKNEFISIINCKNKYEMRKSAIRNAYHQNTVFDNIYYILAQIGMIGFVKPNPSVLIVVPSDIEVFYNMFYSQTYLNKEIVVSSKAQLIEKDYDLISLWDNSIYYPPHWIEERVNAFKYTNCDYITSCSSSYTGQEYSNVVQNKHQTLFWRNAYSYSDIVTFSNDTIIENGYLFKEKK